MSTQSLVFGEKEQPVLHHRSAKGTGQSPCVVRRNAQAGNLEKGRDHSGSAVMAWGKTAVKLISSGLRLCRNNSRQCLAEFCVIVLRSDFRFTDRFNIRINYDDPKDGIAIVSAIQLKRCLAPVLPINVDLNATLRIFTRGMLKTQHRGARSQEF